MNFIGNGIYSIPEASKLTGVSNPRIYRWIRGYSYHYKDTKFDSKPVKTHDYSVIDKNYSISFADLIEIRFINSFKSYGVGWKAIRKAYLHAQEILNKNHPFATKTFYTDKRTIFADIKEKIQDKFFIDLVSKQYELRKVFAHYLIKGIEYSTEDNAIRWWPKGKRRGIVIDPQKSFGQPIIYKNGIPTKILYNSYKNEESIENVAKWYETDNNSVSIAVDFEKSLLKK